MDVQPWKILIDGLREGDPEAERDFWARYGPALMRIAERNVALPLRRRFDPEDAVQSAYRTFLRRANAGQFTIPDSASLWRLLCAITLTKVREKARFHRRQRRDVAREEHDSSSQPDQGRLPRVPADETQPEDAVVFAEEFQRLLEELDDEERQVAQMKLEDYTNREISEHLQCSQRTVERLLRRIRGRWSRRFDEA